MLENQFQVATIQYTSSVNAFYIVSANATITTADYKTEILSLKLQNKVHSNVSFNVTLKLKSYDLTIK